MTYDNAKKQNLDYFSKTLEEAKDEHHAVAQSRISHMKRFEKMLDLGDYSRRSVLDVGCGVGGFYGFLLEKGIQCSFTGIDINPKMIEAAKENYPEISERFMVFDVLEKEMNQSFDYVFSVGPLNLKFEPGVNMDATMKLLGRMYRMSNIGAALSMTSSYTRKPNNETFYFNPAEVMEETAKFCTNVKIDHSYLPHDFTIFCYKQDLYR